MTFTVFPGAEYHDGHSFQTIAMSRMAVPRADIITVTNRDISISSLVSRVKPPDEDSAKDG